MSTHACIAVLRPDASIHSVYVHSDGYWSWTGVRLHRSFNTYKKVTELIAHGGISIVGDEIGKKHDLDAPRIWGDRAVTSFYTRDRGDELEIEHHANFKIFGEYSKEWEYVYFFNGEKWLGWTGREGPKEAKPLAQILIKERLTS